MTVTCNMRVKDKNLFITVIVPNGSSIVAYLKPQQVYRMHNLKYRVEATCDLLKDASRGHLFF